MHSFNVDYQDITQESNKKIKWQYKVLIAILPIICGISLYYYIAADEPLNRPDKQLILIQDKSTVKNRLSLPDKSMIPSRVRMSLFEDCLQELTLIIEDADQEQQEIPSNNPFPSTKCSKTDSIQYHYDLNKENPFFQLKDSQYNIILRIEQLAMSKDHSQYELYIQNKTLYGLGEQENLQPKRQYQIWPQSSLGYQPMWIQNTNQNTTYACLIKSSSPLQFIYEDNLMILNQFGGSLIMKLFLYSSPEQNIKAYHRYINGYRIFPLWAFGLQYNLFLDNINKTQIEHLLNKFKSKKLPIQSIQVNLTNGLSEDDILSIKQEYKIKILTNHLLTVSDDSFKSKLLIRSGQTNKPLIGCINGQQVNYKDYNQKQSINYGNFDGIYLNQNQIVNDFNGEILKGDNCNQVNDQSQTFMTQNSIPLDSFHHKKGVLTQEQVSEQYFRPLNSFAQQLQYSQKDKTKLIISDATFYGSGQYTGHQLRTKEFTTLISQIIENQFYGIPYIGAFGCDQGRDHLIQCYRWLSIQSWLPLFNVFTTLPFEIHNDQYLDNIEQELDLRSQLIKWMYTQLLLNYDREIEQFTGTLIQPIWWFNVSDSQAFKYEQQQFIFAQTYLIVPILKDPLNDYFTDWEIYFPTESCWMQINQPVLYKGGTFINFEILTATMTPKFQKCGTIVSKQRQQERIEDYDNIYNIYGVIDNGQAQGTLLTLQDVSDDNIRQKCLQQNCISVLKLIIEEELNQYGISHLNVNLIIEGLNSDTIFEEYRINQVEIFHAVHHFESIKIFDPILVVNGPISIQFEM